MRYLRTRTPLDESRRALVTRWTPYVLKIAHNLWAGLRRPARDLDEMRGEALLALVDLAASYDPTASPPFEKVMGRKVKWSLLSWFRMERRRPGLVDDPDAVYEVEFPPRPEAPEDEGLLREAVGRLSPPHREILEKRFGLDGSEPLSYVEAGKALGITSTPARVRERKALENLREVLRDLRGRKRSG